jgi:hypothetical protein
MPSCHLVKSFSCHALAGLVIFHYQLLLGVTQLVKPQKGFGSRYTEKLLGSSLAPLLFLGRIYFYHKSIEYKTSIVSKLHWKERLFTWLLVLGGFMTSSAFSFHHVGSFYQRRVNDWSCHRWCSRHPLHYCVLFETIWWCPSGRKIRGLAIWPLPISVFFWDFFFL